jgi:phosphoglycerate dehydrogenase-like enzyme
MIGKRFVATAPLGRVAIDILEQAAPVEVSPTPDEETILGLMEGTIGLVCGGEVQITQRIINGGSELRVLGRSGVGYDSVDVEAATARGIPLVYAPVAGFAVAESALALLLALVKQIPRGDQVVKSGQWRRRYDYHTGDLMEHTLGIVGLGRIGLRLAELVQPFNMRLLGYDPYVAGEGVKALGIEQVGLDELLLHSDYVSLHVFLSEETRGLINRERIAGMKRGAILINVARGGVVESLDVLADALESGQFGGTGLDVFPQEPPDASHRIFKHPRCLCAPHMAGSSELAVERVLRSMASDMVAVVQGRRPQYCVNPQVFDEKRSG